MLGSGHERGAAADLRSPVDEVTRAAVDALAGRLNPSQSRILLAHVGGSLAGWVALSRDPSPLIAHWGVVSHLQTQLARRNAGHRIGPDEPGRREVARDEMGLEQLHLAVRGGMGLDVFDGLLGWRVTGRWPGSGRLGSPPTTPETRS